MLLIGRLRIIIFFLGDVSAMSELLKGQVKWFNDAKGFGFIEHESGKDVFVHYSIIEGEGFKTLKDGEEVEYSLKEGDKGLNASRVIRLNQKEAGQKAQAASMSSMIEVEKVEDKKNDDAPTLPAEQIQSIESQSTSE